MQVLVTGAHGHIGSHLVAKLEALGHTVLRGDRKGTVPTLVDWIFDLCVYGNYYDQTDKKLTWKVNNERAAKLIDNAKGCKAIVMMSTSSVTLPVLTPYALSKLAMECYAQAIAKVDKRPIVIARPYTVYGIGDSPKHLIPTIFRSCLQGKKMMLDPTPVHDYIYVDDLVEGLILCAKNAKKIKGKVISFGTGTQTTNQEVVMMVEAVTQKKANVIGAKNLRKYDTAKWVAQIGEAQKLGWKPTTDLMKGLNEIFKAENTGD
jgi:nucleoside-diphosphate-sugar epimerase